MSFRVAFLQCVSQNYGKIHSVVVIFIRDNIRKCETINANNFIKRSCSAKITNKNTLYYFYLSVLAGPRSAIGRAPGFDTRSGNILSFLLPLFQEGQLSVTGESMCTKYCSWLTA